MQCIERKEGWEGDYGDRRKNRRCYEDSFGEGINSLELNPRAILCIMNSETTTAYLPVL